MAKRKDGVNEYSCTCVAGYTGDKCQTGMLEYHDICRCSSPTSFTYKANFNQLEVSGIEWSSHNQRPHNGIYEFYVYMNFIRKQLTTR